MNKHRIRLIFNNTHGTKYWLSFSNVNEGNAYTIHILRVPQKQTYRHFMTLPRSQCLNIYVEVDSFYRRRIAQFYFVLMKHAFRCFSLTQCSFQRKFLYIWFSFEQALQMRAQWQNFNAKRNVNTRNYFCLVICSVAHSTYAIPTKNTGNILQWHSRNLTIDKLSIT